MLARILQTVEDVQGVPIKELDDRTALPYSGSNFCYNCDCSLEKQKANEEEKRSLLGGSSLRIQPPLIAHRRLGRSAREASAIRSQKFHTDDVDIKATTLHN